MRDTQREGQRHRQREKQAPHREPDAGLDPGTPESHPGPKAGAIPLSHPEISRPSFKTVSLDTVCQKKRRYCTPKKGHGDKERFCPAPTPDFCRCPFASLCERKCLCEQSRSELQPVHLWLWTCVSIHLFRAIMQPKSREDQIIMTHVGPGLLECLLDGQSYAAGSCY